MSIFAKLSKFFSAAPSFATSWSAADLTSLGKATSFVERFREVVSDPINLLIARVPEAGYIDSKGRVVLHNGIRVPLRGPGSYYNDFSDLLVINRGVHEPLEEYCFQQMLAGLSDVKPVMLELGSYWAHYSMWLKKLYPQAICHMVESDATNLEAGRENFKMNGLKGEFHQGLVGRNGLQVDAFLQKHSIEKLDILHSDIQGHEVEMIEGAASSLAAHRIKRIFVSTHSNALHEAVEASLRAHGYLIEISSNFDSHTSSYDGFILASAPECSPLMGGWIPLGRLEIASATPEQRITSIASRLSLNQ
jgi:hypothetical protein